MYYVYLLFSGKDKKLYTGYSSDLKTRIENHLKGNVSAMKLSEESSPRGLWRQFGVLVG